MKCDFILVFLFFFFFFNDTATTEIYTVMNTLSLHDALPISPVRRACWPRGSPSALGLGRRPAAGTSPPCRAPARGGRGGRAARRARQAGRRGAARWPRAPSGAAPAVAPAACSRTPPRG